VTKFFQGNNDACLLGIVLAGRLHGFAQEGKLQDIFKVFFVQIGGTPAHNSTGSISVLLDCQVP
jgi:hypothetical protein